MSAIELRELAVLGAQVEITNLQQQIAVLQKFINGSEPKPEHVGMITDAQALKIVDAQRKWTAQRAREHSRRMKAAWRRRKAEGRASRLRKNWKPAK